MTITNRREAIAMTAAASVAAGLPDSAAAQAAGGAGNAASQQAPGFYRWKVGDITVTAVHDGFAQRPLENFIRNAEMADIRRAMAEAFLPQDALPITFTTLVVQTGGKTVLIDTGNGEFGAPTSGNFLANFRAAGFDPARVDQVIISHFHGDHINGIRNRDGTLRFPNAEIAVPLEEWAFWTSEERMNAAPEAMRPAFQNVQRVFGPNRADVKRFAPEAEVAPGITALAAYGHTPGHNIFAISSGQAKHMFVADITNHPALFVRNPDWQAVFDMDGEMARAARRRILHMAAEERTALSFFHAPFPAVGHILQEGDRYRFVPVQWTPSL